MQHSELELNLICCTILSIYFAHSIKIFVLLCKWSVYLLMNGMNDPFLGKKTFYSTVQQCSVTPIDCRLHLVLHQAMQTTCSFSREISRCLATHVNSSIDKTVLRQLYTLTYFDFNFGLTMEVSPVVCGHKSLQGNLTLKYKIYKCYCQ